MSGIPSREEALFADALARPAAERTVFLDAACNGDMPLRARILALLAAHAGPESLLADAPMPTRGIVSAEEKPGDVIGRYRLLQKVGEGGCGVVWMAEQEEPVRRRVALKIIKLGMDTKAVVARFEAERQALAMMDHPNIAKVHDAGVTDAGRPFFVMELVRGIPITKYCDENHLTPNQRLELFIKVCHAIQHAHQKGVIHRDIKPSNILVTVNDGSPTPKVIDFGIAKATQGRLTDATVFTAFEQFIGTPVYMSPEQAEMSSLDIDTRSDIYSLGVLLYELLTGRPPFDPKTFAQAGVDQIRKQIREVEPPRPSARLRTLDQGERTTIARLRNTAASDLSIALRGDLDWIVMRCIEKDRTRRYDTANGLAMDIQRYLRNEPVIARPPSTAYLLQKLIRRHRLGFAAAAAIAAALVVGLAISSWSLVKEKRSRELAVVAEREQNRLRENAVAQERIARQRAYAADINLVRQALAIDNLGRARELLYRQIPRHGERDLRGWEWQYLWQFCQADPHKELSKQQYPISSLSASADGSWLATGEGEKGGLSVQNLRTFDEYRLPAGDEWVLTAFSPRQPLLAFSCSEPTTDGGRRNSVKVWNFVTRQIEEELDLTGRCASINFSSDGRTLVTSTADAVTLWRIPGGDKLGGFGVQQASVGTTSHAFALSADLRLAAYHFRRNEIRVVDVKTGEERWTVSTAGDLAAALAFSPNGKILASGSGYAESVIRLWDVASGSAIGRLEGHRAWVSDLMFWPDGTKLGSASGDQTIRIWDVASRRLLRTFRGHKGEVFRIALLPDHRLASAGKDGTVYLWDVTLARDDSAFVKLPEEIAAWRFADDGKAIYTLAPNGRIAEWRGRGFQQRTDVMALESTGLRELRDGDSAALGQYFALFCDNRPLLAIGSQTGTTQVWDFARRRLIREFKISSGPVYPVGFCHQGERLIIYEQTKAYYYQQDIVTGTETASWPGPSESRRFSFTLTPDEAYCLMIGYNGKAAVRDMKTGFTTSLDLSIRRAESPKFSPDGRYFAAGSQMGLPKIWQAANREELAMLSGFMLSVNSVAFSPDSMRLATGSNGVEAIRLWDVESHQQLLTLEAQGSLFRATAFSPDGNVLGSRDHAGVLHLWRAPSWAEIEAAEKAQAVSMRRL